jgi:hypothetical protein
VWPLSDFSYSPVSKSHTFKVASSLADTITLKTGWNITCKRKYRSTNYIHYLAISRGKDKRSIQAYVITSDLYTAFRGHFCSHTFISVAAQVLEALLLALYSNHLFQVQLLRWWRSPVWGPMVWQWVEKAAWHFIAHDSPIQNGSLWTLPFTSPPVREHSSYWAHKTV